MYAANKVLDMRNVLLSCKGGGRDVTAQIKLDLGAPESLRALGALGPLGGDFITINNASNAISICASQALAPNRLRKINSTSTWSKF